MVVRIQNRHDTAKNWQEENPTLFVGEIGVETDGYNRIKVGNGINSWNNLPYFDEHFVHNYGKDVIEGVKEFLDDVTFGAVGDTVKLTVNGDLDVTGALSGTISNAYADEFDNNIHEYYQRKLTNVTPVDASTDWNSVVEEGIYNISLDRFLLNLHQPNSFNENISTKGMLIVHNNDPDGAGIVMQMYVPMEATDIDTVVSTVYRYCVNGTWSSWVTVSTGDPTVVHITDRETIVGEKSFLTTPSFLSGVANLNSSGSAIIQRSGENFIRKDANGELFISASGNNIYLRPAGDISEDNQVIIGTDGIVDGKCLKDGEGRNIVETYATKDSIGNSSINLYPQEIKEQADDEVAYNIIVDSKYDNFDASRFSKAENLNGFIVTSKGIVECSKAGYYQIPLTSMTPQESVTVNIRCIWKENSALLTNRSLTTCNEWSFEVQPDEEGLQGSHAYFEGLDISDLTCQVVASDNDVLDFTYTIYRNKIFIKCRNVTQDVETQTEKDVEVNTAILEKVFNKAIEALKLSNSDELHWWVGSIDLKRLKVEIDGIEVISGCKQKVDHIKADNYTVEGEPTITDDGTAYGFSEGNYVKIDTGINTTSLGGLVVNCAFTTGADVETNQRVFEGLDTDTFKFLLYIKEGNLYAKGLKAEAEDTLITAVEPNTSYLLSITFTPNTIYFHGDSGSEYAQAETDLSFEKLAFNLGFGGTIEEETEATEPFKGYFDLNKFKVYVSDEYDVIMQACLRIPYNYSVTGIKIVDGSYLDRLNDCYEQFKTCNYFMLNEPENRFRLPMDNPNGINHVLNQYRNGSTSFEYDTNLECMETGTGTAKTPFVLPKPYADNKYFVSVPCTDKTEAGFTPTADGDFFTKGRICLG